MTIAERRRVEEIENDWQGVRDDSRQKRARRRIEKMGMKREKMVLSGLALAVIVALLPITSVAFADSERAYDTAYADAIRDYHTKGWDPSCPNGHSVQYCMNYQEGYKYGWESAGGTPPSGGTGGGQYTIGRIINGTDQGSYLHGYWAGSLTGPGDDAKLGGLGSNYYPLNIVHTCAINNGQVVGYPPKVNGILDPAVTNTTACEDGWFNGYKSWCINHAVNCVGNITSGYFPDLLIKTHQEYQRGYTASNGSYNLCPIGENNSFCTGWYNNMGERAGECGDNPNNGTFASHNLNGCPLDWMTSDQMAKPSAMIGTWDYVNGTISGKIVYSDYGNFTLKIPSKTAFGDYRLEGSWGNLGHNLLTLCYPYGSCVNNTLTMVTPNHITFLDPHHNVIRLMREYVPLQAHNDIVGRYGHND